MTTNPANPGGAGDIYPELEATAPVGAAGTPILMVFEIAEVVSTEDLEGPGCARDTFPMLDATALVGVARTLIKMVFEATKAASAENPGVSPELG